MPVFVNRMRNSLKVTGEGFTSCRKTEVFRGASIISILYLTGRIWWLSIHTLFLLSFEEKQLRCPPRLAVLCPDWLVFLVRRTSPRAHWKSLLLTIADTPQNWCRPLLCKRNVTSPSSVRTFSILTSPIRYMLSNKAPSIQISIWNKTRQCARELTRLFTENKEHFDLKIRGHLIATSVSLQPLDKISFESLVRYHIEFSSR